MSDPDPKTPLRRRGLGMGLQALLGGDASLLREADAPGQQAPRSVGVAFLRPSRFQPRRQFDAVEMEALAASIRAKGVIQPLLVRRIGDAGEGYEIVAGERRWRAAQAAGLHEVPVVVREMSDGDALEAALIENIQRADLNPIEEAMGYRRLLDEFGHTQEELAKVVGRSRSHVANTMRLLALPEEVREMVESGRLSAGHARALIGAADPIALAREVLARGLNVRQTEALARAAVESPPPPRPPRGVDPNIESLERDLSERLGLRVSLRAKGRGGVLRIAYSSLDQLDGLLRRLA
jgi:ParB family transcriptional regulator, chromosome partitioning protein